MRESGNIEAASPAAPVYPASVAGALSRRRRIPTGTDDAAKLKHNYWRQPPERLVERRPTALLEFALIRL
jgi:hypothetical protein